jgi:GxxExxY protein
MHPLFEAADKLSHVAIGATMEVHGLKGPGLIESIYERCVMREFELRQIAAVNQQVVRIEYKGMVFDEPLQFDVLVENCLLLELKCVKEILPIQGAVVELHEVVGCAIGVDYQFLRSEVGGWVGADDLIARGRKESAKY